MIQGLLDLKHYLEQACLRLSANRARAAKQLMLARSYLAMHDLPYSSRSIGSDEITTGQGWYPIEYYRQQAFRWVENDAELIIDAPTGTRRTLSLELEPGPGLGLHPFTLQVLDQRGQVVATTQVKGREVVKVTLPIIPGQSAIFRLHIEGGGLLTPNDSRILNFRVFGVGWSAREPRNFRLLHPLLKTRGFMQIRENWKSWLKPWVPPRLLEVYGAMRSRLTPEERAEAARQETQLSLSRRTLGELFPGIEMTTVNLPVSQLRREIGMLPLTELLTLAAICRHVRPRKVFEIGTYKGASTLVMAMHTPAETEIFTLDLPPQQRATKYPLAIGDITGVPFTVGELYRGTEFETKIHQLYGDSGVFDFEGFYSKVDLVFVDGNHAFENVKADSENAFRILCPGGVIIWDDYHAEWGPGVIRALHEITDKCLYQIIGTRFAIYLDSQ